MTPEQLIAPRYEVIADYLGSNFNIGDVLSLNLIDQDERINKGVYYCYHGAYGPLAEFDLSPYPNIFKLLQWWEKRDFSLAGMYIRAGAKDSIHTCYKLLQKEDHPHMELWTMECGDREHCYPLNGDNIVPIEQSEYNQYIKSKEK
jgi:hypothetical protein